MSSMIYLDNHSSTACDPQVVEAMIPFFSEAYGNPSSTSIFAKRVADRIEESRNTIATLIGASTHEVVFTSGATEANNLVLLGIDHRRPGRSTVVSTAIEHKSVLMPIARLAEEGIACRWLPVDRHGTISGAHEVIDDATSLVSVQLASNEIGTIQDIRSIADRCARVGALLHCDATQGVGKIPVDVGELGVDFLTFSGHKMYGPKGVGALFCRSETRSLLRPLMFGGGQEKGIKPGTLNVPAIIGFGVAAALCEATLNIESRKLLEIRDTFEARLRRRLPPVVIQGKLDRRLPNNSSVTFPNADAELLLAAAEVIVASSGSACSQGTYSPSHVLTSIGLTYQEAFSTVRFGFGRFNTISDAENAAARLAAAYDQVVERS